MHEMDRIYAGYGFASHKGYPTLEHLQALKEHGPLPIHRRSFTPVRQALGLDPIQGELFRDPGGSTQGASLITPAVTK